MKEHKRKICIWPDCTWCFKKDIEEYSWMSDDYVVREIFEKDPEYIESIVVQQLILHGLTTRS